MTTSTTTKTYYYLYQLTNTLNNKIYIGVHQTRDLDDDYMGSGTYLNRAKDKNLREHGEYKFKKEILEYFDNQQDMYRREAEIVTQEFCDRQDTYNIKPGGRGGFSDESGLKGRNKILDKLKTDQEFSKIMKQHAKKGSQSFVNRYQNDKEFSKQIKDAATQNLAKGRQALTEKYPKGSYKYYNNGIVIKIFRNDQVIPEGWTHGSIKRKKQDINGDDGDKS